MRTKTLLIAAASALAAAVTSAQAQTVYSQNIVGYVNLALTPNQDAMISPALDVDGTGTNGTISTVVGTNVAVGTTVYVWNGTGYNVLGYGSLGRGLGDAWQLSGVSGATNNYPLNVGQGFFINDPSDTNILETGVVMQGALTQNLPANQDSLVSSIVPIAGDLDTNLNYSPSVGDSVFIWNGNGFNVYGYGSLGRGLGSAWQLSGQSGQNDPVISVGQGFFIEPANANAWTETFTNN